MKSKQAPQTHPIQKSFFSLSFSIALFVMAALASAPAQQTPRAEVFLGYSYLRFETTTIGFANTSNLNGFEFSPAYNFTKSFGIAADASGHYGNHQQVYSFLIGPQLLLNKFHGTIFGHVFFGKTEDKVHVNLGGSSNGRAVALGLGYDRVLNQRFTFRVIQADYLDSHVFGVGQNNLRVSTGLVMHWGERKK